MRPGRRFALLLLLSLAGCPKRVLVNGQELPVHQADALARPELSEARRQAAALPPAAGADRLLAFAARFRGTPSAAEALHEAATLQQAARQPERAAQTLGTLLGEHPLYPRADEARYQLARIDLERGRAADGLRTLESIYPRLDPARRAEAAALGAQAALATGAAPAAVRWLGELATITDGEQRREAQGRLADAVDRLSEAEVARLRQELPREAPAQEPLTMKAARIALHLRDYPRAQETAREVFLRWPGGPYAAEAKEIVEKVGRLSFVRPDVIGLAVPLSGSYQPWGEAILRAVQLALGDRPVARVAVRDTRGEPDGAVTAIEALALEEGAIVVVGGVTNAEAERAAATAEELALPFVSLSKEAGLTAAGPNVFQNMLTAPAQARALADHAMGRLGLRRFVILNPSITYGVELASAFRAEVLSRGGVLQERTYEPERTTFTPLVKELVGKANLEARADWARAQREIAEREKDPYRRKKALEKARDRLAPVTDFEAIFVPDFGSRVKLVAPALAVEDVVTQTCLPDEVKRIARVTGRPDLRPVQLLGANGWGSDPSLFDVGPGGAGRHVRCAVFVDGFFAGSDRPATRAFVDAFAQAHAGQQPTILEASAYDAAGMARLQIERRVQTRAQMRDGLATVSGFPGATGDITMGPDRTPQKELFFLTVDPQLGLRELTPEERTGHGAAGQP